MRVTASQILNWANTKAKEAQTDLPRLVRRLCYLVGSTRQIAFPAGDSTYTPGWDGTLFSEQGNAWVPVGASCWEMGCDRDINDKANTEYLKRTGQTDPTIRATTTFVFVSPRRWNGKAAWIASQKAKVEWADVRAYDADDLEQWLEQTPSVALQFAEELGLMGPEVESPERHWQLWASQCDPAITFEVFFTDRTATRDRLLELIRGHVSRRERIAPLTLSADSMEEAAAFVAAALLECPELADQTLVVTETDGWRFVEANPQLRIALAARTEVAGKPVLRKGLVLIVPHAIGDMTGESHGDELILEQPNIYDFEKALIAIGMEASDARRYALSNGRSWSVLRRRRANNPAIRHPLWLDKPQAQSLATLCLLGAWTRDKAADRRVVEQVAARGYEEIEADLGQLVQLDDAPILSIGAVWKAKSPLELLDLFGDRITRDQLDRFFQIARELLAAPDPQLELPDDQRYAAQVYGKVHPHSGRLFDSICDALIKLAVRGPEKPSLYALDIEGRVARLVRDLLDNADGTGWLSLASHLPALAEAAPEAFLSAVENSLRQPNAPVTQLITETSSSGFGGRCWHAGLLWALETLAWAPKRLARVALILARLTQVPYNNNWGNTPGRSLLGLFRTWLPQTAADLQLRIAVLDLLIERNPEAAFNLFDALTERGSQIATPAHRPKWRDEDAGAGREVSRQEMDDMVAAVRDRMFRLSAGNVPRIVRLFENTGLSNRAETTRVLALMQPYTQPNTSDEDRESLLIPLRKLIYWHRNYDETQGPDLDERLAPIERFYEGLTPVDLVKRHRWLFSTHWPDLPIRHQQEEGSDGQADLVTHARTAALKDIADNLGRVGVVRLVKECGDPGRVGIALVNLGFGSEQWAAWLIEEGGDFAPGAAMSQFTAGMLRTLPEQESTDLLREVMALGEQQGWEAERFARLLLLARPLRATWELAAVCGPETETTYWDRVQPNYWLRDMGEDADFVLRRLLDAKRPRTALQSCQFDLEKTEAKLLYAMLQQFMLGEEADGPLLKSWHLAKMLERLEQSEEIEPTALIQLEFGLFPALGYGNDARAAALYAAVTSNPAIFTELITLLYKPEHGEREEAVNEVTQEAASRSWQILHHCTRLPGTRSDGSVDQDAFFRFIDEARELCRQADRLTMCEQTLGQILAHAPTDEDGTWPFAPARQVLDRPEMEEMRLGFAIGTGNKRGVTTRSPWDGGKQERDLAAHYRALAGKVQHSQPYVAAMLEDIAKTYDWHGSREDVDANLRKEGY